MSTVFLKVLNLSINATWLILVVLMLRFMFNKSPKWISCALWVIVAVRLTCPFSFESVFSLLPSSEVIPSNIAIVQTPEINTGVTVINNALNPIISKTSEVNEVASVNTIQVVIFIATVIWVCGMIALLAYAVISYILLKKKVRGAVPFDEKILECDEIMTPFILGIIRPKIYIPTCVGEETLEMVLAHEKAHLKRFDHWWKPFGFLLLSVYWFNPICWIAYFILCRDIEAACDERVIRDKDKNFIVAYSQALLDLSVSGKFISACPVAFGENGVKMRIKGVLSYRKPKFWVISLAILCCIAVILCFLTTPITTFKKSPNEIDRISVFDGRNGNGFEIENDEELKQIINYMNEMHMNRDKVSLGHMGYGFRITLYSSDKQVETFILNSENIVRKDPFFYNLQEKTGLYDYLDLLCNQNTTTEAEDADISEQKDVDNKSSDMVEPEQMFEIVHYPDEIYDVVSIDVTLNGNVIPSELGLADGQTYHLRCEDPLIISQIVGTIWAGKEEKAQSKCPFDAMMSFGMRDGKWGYISLATDSCSMYMLDGICYSYSDGSNENLWKLIGEFDLVGEDGK